MQIRSFDGSTDSSTNKLIKFHPFESCCGVSQYAEAQKDTQRESLLKTHLQRPNDRDGNKGECKVQERAVCYKSVSLHGSLHWKFDPKSPDCSIVTLVEISGFQHFE